MRVLRISVDGEAIASSGVDICAAMLSLSKPKRQRVDLTWAEKKQICEMHKEKPSFSHLELAKYMVEHHGFRLVNRSTISRTLEESPRWLEVSPNVREGKTKRVRDAKWPQVDKAIMLWFGQMRARRRGGIVVTDATLVEKATEFRDVFGISREDFKLSHGWLEKFKSRHGILCHNNNGESRDDNDDVDVGVAHAKLLATIATYDPEDVFNFDETGLYYKLPPSKSAKEKACVTLGLCANTSGKDRLKMVFIHKAARPRCFPASFDPSPLVHYYSNRHAWMNGDIFTTWITGENKAMAAKGRKILILLDTAASHNVKSLKKTKIGELDAFVLSNITLLFFPANVTSVVHPLDHGIITALKLRYRSKLVTWSLAESAAMSVEALQVNLLQCLLWLVASWSDLDAETFQNAWIASKLLCGDITDSQQQEKLRRETEVAELERLIAVLDVCGEKLGASEYVNLVDDDDVEAEYSTQQIVDLVVKGEVSLDCGADVGKDDGCEEDELDGESDERVGVVDLVEARICGLKLLDFMVAQGSFECCELLQVERICDKVSRKYCWAPGVSTAAEQSDIKSSAVGD